MRVRRAVLARDAYICRIARGCTRRAEVADHIIPVTPDMPDAMFFGLHNLRAGCQPHNRARPVMDRDEADRRLPRALVTGDYSRGE